MISGRCINTLWVKNVSEEEKVDIWFYHSISILGNTCVKVPHMVGINIPLRVWAHLTSCSAQTNLARGKLTETRSFPAGWIELFNLKRRLASQHANRTNRFHECSGLSLLCEFCHSFTGSGQHGGQCSSVWGEASMRIDLNWLYVAWSMS